MKLVSLPHFARKTRELGNKLEKGSKNFIFISLIESISSLKTVFLGTEPGKFEKGFSPNT